MKNANLVYSIICDDVRLEMGNKLSLMGVFENIFFPSFPSALLKFSVVNHWVGVGQFETFVRILSPDKREVVVSVPSKFSIEGQGYADNVTFFTNVAFERPGSYSVQTHIDGKLVAERPLYVHHVVQPPSTVN
ncbi:MAG: hypothetical protein HY646_06285 [Acidobacteria bacterium]|nr:hypothetical protein [Acidobacteriota bacterium]